MTVPAYRDRTSRPIRSQDPSPSCTAALYRRHFKTFAMKTSSRFVADRLDDLRQELAGPPDEREPLLVLVAARSLARRTSARPSDFPGRRRCSSGSSRACSAGSPRGTSGGSARSGIEPGHTEAEPPAACRSRKTSRHAEVAEEFELLARPVGHHGRSVSPGAGRTGYGPGAAPEGADAMPARRATRPRSARPLRACFAGTPARRRRPGRGSRPRCLRRRIRCRAARRR